MNLKQMIVKELKPVISAWGENDIYAISFYYYNDRDNPSQPILEVGYNTLSNYYDCLEEGVNGMEAKWNYAYWLQNTEYTIGDDETKDIIEDWVLEQGFPYCTYEQMFHSEAGKPDFDWNKITKAFVQVLIEVARELHWSDFIREKFSEPIPVIIHELEYYDEIAEINIAANGRELVEDFVQFIETQ